MTTVQLTGVDNVLNLLRSLPTEVVSKRGGPVRAALRKGAAVIFKQARSNLERSIANTEDAQSTGLLIKNLVITRGKEPTGTRGERYLVRVKRKSYARKGARVTTLKTAHLLEYGSRTQPAEPWLRPAFNATARQAIDTTTSELLRAIDRIVRKLGKQGGLS